MPAGEKARGRGETRASDNVNCHLLEESGPLSDTLSAEVFARADRQPHPHGPLCPWHLFAVPAVVRPRAEPAAHGHRIVAHANRLQRQPADAEDRVDGSGEQLVPHRRMGNSRLALGRQGHHYGAYRALAEEADAFAVQTQVKRRIKSLITAVDDDLNLTDLFG